MTDPTHSDDPDPRSGTSFWPQAPAPKVLRADLTAGIVELRFAARWDSAAGRLELDRVAGGAASSEI